MASMMDRVRAAEDLPRERVEVPEWGLAFLVRGMTAAEKDSWEQCMIADRDPDGELHDIMAKLVVRCALDPETGERAFGDGDAVELSTKSATAVERLYEAAERLSKVGRHREGVAKNSETGLDGSSSSS